LQVKVQVGLGKSSSRQQPWPVGQLLGEAEQLASRFTTGPKLTA
jgi:hypothetical protein